MEKKKLFHHCFVISAIGQGDHIPVGGGTIGSSDTPYKVSADFENIYPRFAGIAEKVAVQLDTPSWHSWMDEKCPDIPRNLAMALQIFTNAFEPKRRIQDTNKFARSALYENAPDHCLKLSDIFNSNKALCVETSILAKKFLDEKGIQCRLFSGEFLQELDPDGIHVPAMHTFLIIDHEGQEYIYDPTRPNILNGQAVFALSRTCESFSSLEGKLKKDCLLIAVDDVISKRREFYGVGDTGDIPSKYIVATPAAKM